MNCGGKGEWWKDNQVLGYFCLDFKEFQTLNILSLQDNLY